MGHSFRFCRGPGPASRPVCLASPTQSLAPSVRAPLPAEQQVTPWALPPLLAPSEGPQAASPKRDVTGSSAMATSGEAPGLFVGRGSRLPADEAWNLWPNPHGLTSVSCAAGLSGGRRVSPSRQPHPQPRGHSGSRGPRRPRPRVPGKRGGLDGVRSGLWATGSSSFSPGWWGRGGSAEVPSRLSSGGGTEPRFITLVPEPPGECGGETPQEDSITGRETEAGRPGVGAEVRCPGALSSICQDTDRRTHPSPQKTLSYTCRSPAWRLYARPVLAAAI